MSNWNQILREINETHAKTQNTHDIVRQQYLNAFSEVTNRNVLSYYSGWLENPDSAYVSITDEDINGFMSCFYQMDFKKGLDLFIHSPGGDVAATESIIKYIRSKFKDDVRVFVPQLAMSGGTMIALCGKEIWMGSHSSLGPIDPHFGGLPAQLILSEFDEAHRQIKEDPSKYNVWYPILSQLDPTMLTQSELAIQWSKTIGIEALISSMFINDNNKQSKAEKAVDFLTNANTNKNHNRHLHRDECRQGADLNIIDIENSQKMQDAIMSIHHANMLSLMNTPVVKIIENHLGTSFVKALS